MTEKEKNKDYQSVVESETERLRRNLEAIERFGRVLDEVRPNSHDPVEFGRSLGSVAINIVSMKSEQFDLIYDLGQKIIRSAGDYENFGRIAKSFFEMKFPIEYVQKRKGIS